MTLPPFVFGLATVPFFATRLFLTAFMLCLIAFLHQTGELDGVLGWGPLQFDLAFNPWLANPFVMLTFGGLAVAEMIKDQSSDFRSIFEIVDAPAKAAGTAVVESGITVSTALASAGSGFYLAALDPKIFWVAIPAVLVWLVAQLRAGVWGFINELDPDDDLGVQRLLSWGENAWVVTGMLCFVVLPSLALIIAGFTVAGLFALERYAAHREKQLQQPCPHCAAPNHGSALRCAACKQALPEPKSVGLLGQPLDTKPVIDPRAHQLRLALKKRCTMCATRLPKYGVQQNCPSCDQTVFDSLESANTYLDSVDRKLPKTLLISTLLSAVPILGLAPGIVYYRMSLIAGLRGYTPRMKNVALRWIMRGVVLLLLAFQWVPGLGALSLPLMCWLNYQLYRGAFVKERNRVFATAVA